MRRDLAQENIEHLNNRHCLHVDAPLLVDVVDAVFPLASLLPLFLPLALRFGAAWNFLGTVSLKRILGGKYLRTGRARCLAVRGTRRRASLIRPAGHFGSVVRTHAIVIETRPPQ